MSQNSIRKLLLFLLVLLTPLSSYFIYWISSSMLKFYKAVEAKPSYITSIILDWYPAICLIPMAILIGVLTLFPKPICLRFLVIALASIICLAIGVYNALHLPIFDGFPILELSPYWIRFS